MIKKSKHQNKDWHKLTAFQHPHKTLALAGVAQWIEHRLPTKGLPVQFPVRACAWVAGQVPNEGHMRGNHTLMFLSLSVSLPSPLSKNK